MEYTTNYKLKKPGDQDNVLVGALNENMDKVDTTMKALSAGKANLDPDTGKVEESELPEFLKLIGGTMKGPIQMANFLVKGLPDPQEDGDAARKAYVDALRTYLDTGGFAKIQTGTYTGTGAYGQSAQNILTFNFTPKFVYIVNKDQSEIDTGQSFQMWPYLWGANTFGTKNGSNANLFACAVNTYGNTMQWYGTISPIMQLNESGITYLYIAIG